MAAETAPAQPPRSGLRRVVRAVLWPLRRFFDPRFTGVYSAVQEVKRLLITDMESANETATLTGRTLDRVVAQNELLLARLDTPETIVDGEYESFAAAYAFRALSAAPARASVAVVGSGSAGRSLAALGYDVTNELGLRTSHHEGEFDVVVCLSLTANAELRRRLHHLTKDRGLLVLGATVGPVPVEGTQHVYDQAGLDELLEDWEPTDVTLVRRREAASWVPVDGRIGDLDGSNETVALVTATKRPD